MSPEDTSASAGRGNVAAVVATTTPLTMEESIPVKASFRFTIFSADAAVVVVVDVVVVVLRVADDGLVRSKAMTTRIDGDISNMVIISLKVVRDFRFVMIVFQESVIIEQNERGCSWNRSLPSQLFSKSAR
jgi:hypothetical protein